MCVWNLAQFVRFLSDCLDFTDSTKTTRVWRYCSACAAHPYPVLQSSGVCLYLHSNVFYPDALNMVMSLCRAPSAQVSWAKLLPCASKCAIVKGFGKRQFVSSPHILMRICPSDMLHKEWVKSADGEPRKKMWAQVLRSVLLVSFVLACACLTAQNLV